MTLFGRFWHTVVDITTWLTLSPLSEPNYRPSQQPLGVPVTHSSDTDLLAKLYGGSPVFAPPATDKDPDHDFKCDYSLMDGWLPCSTPDNRECWLRHPNGSEFNINTNYENRAPIGITRHYVLNITEGDWNADGLPFTSAKLFNGKYPGPWIEACWGDTLHVTVINSMNTTMNGTSIHWHGIRQNQTMIMDGVNGITQCPIPPLEQYTYVFKATQYGTSWYHSHYSVQYADGLQGPLTIHGPSSAPFDTSKRPLLMTDWTHTSAFNLLFNRTWGEKTILFNGVGNVSRYEHGKQNLTTEPTLPVPEPYTLLFEKTPTKPPTRPKRYLLRLINTSFDSTFVFSIDNHWLQVISADFVPIEPYYTTSVLVGIGQRYNIIVEANPQGGEENEIADDGNYWIRTHVPKGCGIPPGKAGYERTGILRYDPSSTAEPNTTAWDVSLKCSDQPYEKLKPKLPWYVGKAANAKPGHAGEHFYVGFDGEKATKPPMNETYPLARFSLQPAYSKYADFTPLQINYSDPVMMHLDESTESFPPKWVVIPENYTETEWVYLILTMETSSLGTAAHPIHLHGHDFALLQQVEGKEYHPNRLNLKLDNPPRRDVVLLPQGGFVVIAFKADNPGIWLMHCHIARHASEGLALQIMERQSDAAKLFRRNSPDMNEAARVCEAWKKHQAKYHVFEGDSGI